MTKTLAQQIADYWDTRAEGYSLRTKDELSGSRVDAWIQRLKTLLDLPAGAEVADIGCGPGFLALAAARCGWKAHGCDSSQDMISEAAGNASRDGLVTRSEIEFHLCDAAALPFADNSLDAVLSRNVLWNLPDPKAALAEWLRVLKPGARLVYEDGNHYRYLDSADYRAVKDAEPIPYGHSEKFMLGVSTAAIDRIAEGLPLTHQDRPGWDLDALLALGCDEVCVLEPQHAVLPARGDEPERQLISSFIICARKCPQKP